MEYWRFALIFAATVIPIIAAQSNMFYGNRFLAQPNVANIPQPNVTNKPGPIEVVACEFYIKDNAKAHRTEDYDLLNEKDPSPVLRRGQPFRMAIRFNRPFNVDSDSVTVELTLGSTRMKVRGAPINLPVTPKKEFTNDPSNWDISLSSNQKNILTLQIQIPTTAGVGIWRMKVISKMNSQDQPKIYDCKKDIYILFNPWNKGDLVYMQNEVDRREYVLSDVGDIYTGVFRNRRPKPWNYGQHDRTVLPASIFILEKSQNLNEPYLDFASRGDPVKVVLAIAAMVNNLNDDDGVLVGKWDKGEDEKHIYKDGIPPWEWTGSVPILSRYMQNGGKYVKYGQCWVFSGLSTTICRALGIPCRSVTNFVSAIDEDGTLTMDVIEHRNGTSAMESETDWNYHVWNECWMTRPDLPANFSGWQAFDGSPVLEDKDGIYRAGPASVEAIRRGEITHMYDTKVFYAAVNSDSLIWILDENNSRKVLHQKDTRYVGRAVVTQRPLINIMEDITSLYKAKEGTTEERRVYQFARKKLGFHRYLQTRSKKCKKKDVCFKLRDIEEIMIGKKFQMIVDVANKSFKNRKITFALSINSVYYTGTFAKKVKSDNGTFILQPWQKRELIFEVDPDQYLDKLVAFLMLRAFAYATVFETKQTWATEHNFQFNGPPLQIYFEDESIRPKISQPFKISFSFTNPLEVPLEDCAIIIEGSGLIEYSKTLLSNIGPGEELSHVETITPRKVGSHKILAVFSSRLLVAIVGSKQLLVEKE